MAGKKCRDLNLINYKSLYITSTYALLANFPIIDKNVDGGPEGERKGQNGHPDN